MTLEGFLLRLLIGCLVYWLFNHVVKAFIIGAQAQKIFDIILLVVVILYVLLGGYLFSNSSILK